MVKAVPPAMRRDAASVGFSSTSLSPELEELDPEVDELAPEVELEEPDLELELALARPAADGGSPAACARGRALALARPRGPAGRIRTRFRYAA